MNIAPFPAMGAHGAPRLASFDYRGFRAYSVTCCTDRRRSWFVEPATVEAARLQLLQRGSDNAFEISAYCFMPDHVHLVLEAVAAESDLRRLISGWKQKTGYEHAKTTKQRLWQQGYYDHVLRHAEDRLEAIAYLVENPLRAGLVRDIADYPFWGSGVWTREALLEAIQIHRTRSSRSDRGG